jgi:pentatricopeptide repeat protein
VTPTGVTDEKSGTENKNSESKEDNVVDAGNMLSPKTPNANNLTSSEMSSDEPRSRFRDTLSSLQIEEATATAKAQLGLAFEMLTMMKNRGLKADPQAYQCLVDACGRCGDTERATELLGKMHEDGIVADGVVYSCLVSAFSADNAMRKIHGKADEDLPGMFCCVGISSLPAYSFSLLF